MTWILAHGIGGIRDLPVPRYVFFYGAAGVLVVSFAALAFLWRKPVLAERRDGRPLPAADSSASSSPPRLRVVVGALSFALLVFLWLGALVGKNDSGVNFTPTFVYVYFWIGDADRRRPVRQRLVGARPVARGGGGRRLASGASGCGTSRRSSTRSGSAAGRPRCCCSRSRRWS